MTIHLDCLRDCLTSTPPIDLLGMRLLREQPPLLTTPSNLPRQQLVDAVTEIIAYTERCVAAARHLARLTPIPLTTISLVEFAL